MKYFDEWMPDTPDYPNSGLIDINNVFVKSVEKVDANTTSHDYSPFGMPQYLPTASLSKRCQGFFSAKAPNGHSYNFAGDANDLYLLSAGVMTNVSKSTGVYATPADSYWSFTQYGNRIIATNGYDNVQSFVLGTDTKFSDLSAGAPISYYAASVKDFVVLASQYGNRNTIQWSGIDQPAYWPAPGTSGAITNQSDIQTMPEGGWVTGIVGGVAGVDAVVFTETMVWTMMYSGYPTLFAFKPVDRAKGTTIPGSVVNQGEFIAYIGPDGFYCFDGTNCIPIGKNKVDKWFFQNVNQNFLARITSAVDPINSLLLWSFPSRSSNDGTPDTIIIYNWYYKKWSKVTFSHEFLGRALSEGYTLEQLASFGTLDTLPFGLDSSAWLGGARLLGVFNPSHQYGFISSTTAASYITSGMELADFGATTSYTDVRPITDSASYSAAIGTKFILSKDFVWTEAEANNANGDCPVRATGRYVAVRVEMPANSTWSHLSGYEVTTTPAGLR